MKKINWLHISINIGIMVLCTIILQLFLLEKIQQISSEPKYVYFSTSLALIVLLAVLIKHFYSVMRRKKLFRIPFIQNDNKLRNGWILFFAIVSIVLIASSIIFSSYILFDEIMNEDRSNVSVINNLNSEKKKIFIAIDDTRSVLENYARINPFSSKKDVEDAWKEQLTEHIKNEIIGKLNEGDTLSIFEFDTEISTIYDKISISDSTISLLNDSLYIILDKQLGYPEDVNTKTSVPSVEAVHFFSKSDSLAQKHFIMYSDYESTVADDDEDKEIFEAKRDTLEQMGVIISLYYPTPQFSPSAIRSVVSADVPRPDTSSSSNPLNIALVLSIIGLVVLSLVGENWDHVFHRNWLLVKYSFSNDRSFILKQITGKETEPTNDNYIGLQLDKDEWFHIVLRGKKGSDPGENMIRHFEKAVFKWQDEKEKSEFSSVKPINLSTLNYLPDRYSRRGSYFLNESEDEIQILYCRQNKTIYIAISSKLLHTKNLGIGKIQYTARSKDGDYHDFYWISKVDGYFDHIRKLHGDKT